jgi:membrane protein required for colicin V production
MNAIDWFVLISVGLCALHGAFRGCIKETAHVLAWILGLFAAWHFGRFLEPALGGYLSSGDVRMWAARAIVVVMVLSAGAVIGTVVSHHVKPELPEGMDGILGVGIGALRGVMVLGVMVLLGQLLRMDSATWWQKSKLLPYGEAVANGVRVLVGEERVHHRRVVDLHDGLRAARPAKAA